jgi:hypothetical protein
VRWISKVLAPHRITEKVSCDATRPIFSIMTPPMRLVSVYTDDLAPAERCGDSRARLSLPCLLSRLIALAKATASARRICRSCLVVYREGLSPAACPTAARDGSTATPASLSARPISGNAGMVATKRARSQTSIRLRSRFMARSVASASFAQLRRWTAGRVAPRRETGHDSFSLSSLLHRSRAVLGPDPRHITPVNIGIYLRNHRVLTQVNATSSTAAGRAMGRSTQYQEQADRCLRLANSLIDETTKERLLAMARENAAMAAGLVNDDDLPNNTMS